MEFYDEKLRQCREQLVRQQKLNAMVAELRSQQETLSARAAELDAVRRRERQDVERLEGHSLAAFFYHVIGKKEEKLDQERREAYAAGVKYDAVACELRSVQDELERREAELRGLDGCDERYRRTLAEKTAAVKRAGGPAAEAVLRAEDRLAFLNGQERELREAISAGDEALSMTEQIMDSLNSAESWGIWDLMGGDMFVDLVKYGHLDEAQAGIERLQVQLCRFRTELADVTICLDAQAGVDDFLRFADYFFDGIFADWAVMDQIGRAQGQMESVRRQLESALDELNGLMDAAEAERKQVEAERDALVLDARLERETAEGAERKPDR